MPIELFGVEGVAGVVLRGFALTFVVFAWTMLLVRLVGLRSFSKMTAFDFVSTVATASLIAQACTRDDWFEFAQCLAAIAAIFGVQWLLVRVLVGPWPSSALRNEPLLLMRDGHFLDNALEESNVSRDNLLQKIRGSCANSLAEVRAVVFETTGDIHVMTGEIDPKIMEGVRGWDAASRQ